MALAFQVLDHDPAFGAKIKVIGVGGCGCNAVDHMIKHNVHGVEFIAANTDAQALRHSQASVLLQLGKQLTKGLGAGTKPEVGREAALEDRERIIETIAGADMLFVTAGMGGGTGTGAAPVIAGIAKEMGILTVGVVTKPFPWEKQTKHDAAEAGIEELAQSVDSLIIIPNSKLMEVLGDDIGFLDAFKAADGVLQGAVAGIAEIINVRGLVNVDFADVRTMMGAMGRAMMGTATASGVDRARFAAEQAIACPLLEDVTLAGAGAILVNFTSNNTLKMREVHEAMALITDQAAPDAVIKYGVVIDESMEEDTIRVTLIATGLEEGKRAQQPELRVISTLKTGTDSASASGYDMYDEPAWKRTTGAATSSVFRSNRQGGGDRRPFDPEEVNLPAFLRRQAD